MAYYIRESTCHIIITKRITPIDNDNKKNTFKRLYFYFYLVHEYIFTYIVFIFISL